jgi:hypothetical protein
MTSPTTVTGVDFLTVFVKDYPAAQKFYGELLASMRPATSPCS